MDDYIMRNAHGTYWCRGCGHHSSSRRDLSRHIEAKHIAGEYPCKFCDKVLTTKYNVQRHLNKFHKEEQMKVKQDLEQIAAWQQIVEKQQQQQQQQNQQT